MYETEVNLTVEPASELPAAVIQNFRTLRNAIAARTVLPWGEHCTECVWPSCYSSCDLYSPRKDGKCRRFVNGMVRVVCDGAVSEYILKIAFKRWGKLWSPGNVRLSALLRADRIERNDRRLGTALQRMPLPARLRRFATTKRYSWKKRQALKAAKAIELPDAFVLECFNPNPTPIDLSFTLRPSSNSIQIPFHRLISVKPGFHRETITSFEITRLVDLQQPFGVEVTPNDVADGTLLYFGLMDFVSWTAEHLAATESKPSSRKTVKCVVWDLDNTLWSGVLVEDGPDRLALKPNIREILQELDNRGILLSIASKNNLSDAMAVLRSHGLEHYFLYPQISWGPKSEALKAIARKLNIGMDTFLFLDDSSFELAEVREACLGVRVLDAAEYNNLLTLDACQVLVTEESRTRRRMYQQEVLRGQEAETFSGDYFGFLRSCNIEIRMEPLSTANLDRVHELTQRTNQMNFSGRRYERKVLEDVVVTPHLETHVISCRDRFGSYGIVGFAIVDAREPRLTDLMFSCRVQSKRVEHAVLAHLIRIYTERKGSAFWANYRRTPHNAPSGKVFDDIGMVCRSVDEQTQSLVFPLDRPIPDDRIATIVDLNQDLQSAQGCSPASR